MSDNKAYSAIAKTHLAIIAGNDEQTNAPKSILHWYLYGFFYVGIQPKLPLLCGGRLVFGDNLPGLFKVKKINQEKAL